MALSSGTRLGPYEILSPLGAGGMGEVYRARDTRLDRTVAIKVLPTHLSENSQLKQRFEREARTISSLSHPHICALYDIGHQDGVDFLVMEYLEGETLAHRLEKGPLPKDHVLRSGIEIADALDKAHRQGIVHRDLKPGNVMMTKSGAKLLDFGLAKLREGYQGEALTRASVLPTRDRPLTEEGVVLGTVQYMAPEQLEGKEADPRTDIFALGAVLYEMATGRRAFTGKSKASLISAILSTEPEPISVLQPLVPPALDHVVGKCLAKEPDERWQSAHDVASELKWISEGGSQSGVTAAVASRRKSHPRFSWMLTGIFFLTTLFLAMRTFMYEPKEATVPMRFSLLPPESIKTLDSIAVSPDGLRLAFAATDSQGQSSLWLRSFDSTDAKELPDTADAANPFWSPDSRFIGFIAKGKVKKIAVTGGPPQTLCDATDAYGGTWSQDGLILFASGVTGQIFRTTAEGGPMQAVTTLDRSHHENWHQVPYFLPDGQHFLYNVRSPEEPEHRGLYLGSLDGKVKKHLLADLSAVECASGYLLFVREESLIAQPLDIKNLQLKGEAFPVSEKIGLDPTFSVSANGVLTYATSGLNTQFLLADRSGKQVASIGQPWGYGSFALSPDEKRLAVTRYDPSIGNEDLWLVGLSRGAFSRFTSEPTSEALPVWSPDGARIVFSCNLGRTVNLCQKLFNGSTEKELLLSSKNQKWANDWSSDGRFILYSEFDPSTKEDLWILPLYGDKKPIPYLRTQFNEANGQFSPDGKWIAYVSDETGRGEVYVRSFPATAGGKWQVSTDGGDQPRWRRDGKELFYLAPDRKLMSVSVNASLTFEAGAPNALFETRVIPSTFPGARNQYVVTADGQQFIVNSIAGSGAAPPITVVLNWTRLLKK